MKNKTPNKILIAGLVMVAAVAAFAELQSYKTYTASGTSSAAVLVPQKPQSQVRIVTAIASSDLTTSTLKFYSGAASHYVATANPSTGATNIIVESTNGVVVGNLIYLQGATTTYVGACNSVAGNSIGFAGAIGLAQPLNAEVEVITNVVTMQMGASTNKTVSGTAVYVGNYGRAVYAVVTGTSACTWDALTVHYDSQ